MEVHLWVDPVHLKNVCCLEECGRKVLYIENDLYDGWFQRYHYHQEEV